MATVLACHFNEFNSGIGSVFNLKVQKSSFGVVYDFPLQAAVISSVVDHLLY